MEDVHGYTNRMWDSCGTHDGTNHQLLGEQDFGLEALVTQEHVQKPEQKFEKGSLGPRQIRTPSKRKVLRDVPVHGDVGSIILE